MADQKPGNNPTKRVYTPDITAKERNLEEKHERHHMLLTTTYGLNNSHTKRIHVGLQSTGGGLFAPAVKLSGNYADGVYFNEESWRRFQENIPVMDEYLSGESKFRPERLDIDNIFVSFTTSYGAKALLVAYKENEEEEHSTSNTAEETTTSAPAAKKRKTYNVGVVMQKTTFTGLSNIVKCVDAHLIRLQFLLKNVNDSVRYLINEIELNLPSNYIDRDIVKLTLRGNYNDINRNVRTQINDLAFLDMYFDILFLELTTLHSTEILRTILLKRGVQLE